MERLTFEAGKYVAIEAAVHIARYSVASRLAGGKRILDIACGEGYGSYLMATRWGGKHVTAVDISQEAVDAARGNFNADNITYEVGEADTLSKRYPPGSFDLVVSLETIEHLADPEKFLAEIKAVCTEDATVVISCPNDPAHYEDDTAHNPFHLKTYTAAEFFSMAEASLGPCKQKFAGAPVLGFGSFAYDGSSLRVGESMKSMLNFVETNSPPLLMPPDDAIALDDASYYIGVWSFGDYVPFDATMALYPSALNSAAQAELSAEVSKLRTDIWDLTHASPRIDERFADQQHALKEQALRLSVLGAENKLAREGVAELRQQLTQTEAELSEARAAIASVPWKVVGVYRRVRKFIPEPAMRVIRKAIYRSR